MSRHRPTLAIIGPGRVGRALGRLLRPQRWRIAAVVSRTAKDARAAARAIGAGRPQSRLDAGILAADTILIATPDRSIVAVARQLSRIAMRPAVARVFPPPRGRRANLSGGGPEALTPLKGKMVLHTSGALDRTVLRPLERLGASTGSLHPLQTFSGRGVPSLEGCVCALEGAPAALRAARRICRDLGCVPVVLAPSSKPAYHAAGALAAGHVLAVIEAATRILIALGFSRRIAVRALLPLTRQTLANFEHLGPQASWTGPLARGDFATVARHAASLRRFPREYRDAYAALSRLALLVLSPGEPGEGFVLAQGAAASPRRRRQLRQSLRSA